MGFRKDAYATVWSSERISDVNTKCRISISRKDKETGAYVDDFSGFVNFLGSAAANKALSLKAKDRIRLGDVDVRSKYDKEKRITYYNFSVFSFEIENAVHAEPQPAVDDGEVSLDDDCLPF